MGVSVQGPAVQSGQGWELTEFRDFGGEGGAPVVWKVERDALGLRELFGSWGEVLA